MSTSRSNKGEVNGPVAQADLDRLQATTLLYYLHETNPPTA
jgi:hypothetical protein